MYKKHSYLTLLSFGLLLGFLPAHAYHTPPTHVGLEALPPCTLPAPTNLQMNQPTPLQATYTWAPVVGAAGYLATLTDLNGAGFLIDVVTSPTVTFPVQPGSIYKMTVAALCSLGPPIDPSSNYAERTDRMDAVIIDLVVHRSSCLPSGGPIATLLPGDVYESANLSNGSPYFIEMTTPNSGSALLQFQYLPMGGTGNGVYQVRGIEGTPLPTVQVLTYDFSSYQGPPATGSNARVSILNNAYIGHFAFPTANSITHFSSSNFSTLKIYTTCGNGEGKPGDRSESGEQPSASTSTVQAALDNILPINPFTSNLTLHCAEHPVQAVTARLFDVNGRVQLQREIQPDEFAANTCSLATTDLPPGMYFLRLESAPGVFATHKVVKL